MAEPELIYSVTESDQVIKVWQQDNLRWLEFGDELIQTEIDLDRADYLPESFNRAMLAGVLFTDMPKRVLLAGTGGGSTARYFANRFPEIQGEAVELSAAVIELAKDYFDCPCTGNWDLIQDDIRNYVTQCPHRYDLIVMDIAIDQHTPEWLVERVFLHHCRALLTENGHIAINLIVKDAQAFLDNLAVIRQVFEKQTVCLSLTEHKNILVYAFNQACQHTPQQIEQSLPELQRVWQFEFDDFYQQMLTNNPAGSGII